MTDDSPACGSQSDVSDDARFLAYARDGDASILESLLRAHADRSYTQALRQLGSPADADDAVQEAYVQLARGARGYDGSVPFPAWLGRLLQIACLRVRRADRRRRRHTEAAMQRTRTQPPDGDSGIDPEAVRRAVEKLPASYRAAIDLHYFAGLTQLDTARALGLSENAVAVRIHRGRERLRSMLGSASESSVAVALAHAPTHSAPAAVIAHATTVSRWAADGSLPTTTIPLGFLALGASLMSQHPLASSLTAVILALAAALPFALGVAAADAPPAPRPPAADAHASWWTGPARTLLLDVDPAADVRAAVDWESLRHALATTKPFMLLSDPRAAPAVAHARQQFALWSAADPLIPRLDELVSSTRGFALSVYTQDDPSDPRTFAMLDLGRPTATLDLFLHSNFPGVHLSEASGFSGYRDEEGFFVGTSRERLVLAQQASLLAGAIGREAHPTPPPTAWLRRPMWFETDLGHADLLRAFLRTSDSPDSWRNGQPVWLPFVWDESLPLPKVTASMEPVAGKMTSEVDIDGAGVKPQRPITALADVLARGRLGAAALAIDPSALASLAPPEIDAVVRAVATGEVALSVDEISPVPIGALVIGVHPGPEAARAVRDLLTTMGADPVSGKSDRWTLALPFAVATVALASDRMVIATTDPEPFLHPSPAKSVSESLIVRCDLGALGRSCLPLAYLAVSAHPIGFSQVPIVQLWEGTAAMRDELVITLLRDRTRLSDALIRPDIVARGFAFASLFAKIFPGMDPAEQADRSLSLYSAWEPGAPLPTPAGAMLFRLADGWRAVDRGMDLQQSPALTLEQAQQVVAGMHLIGGTALAALTPLPVPEAPRFDRAWLPPADVLAEHLPMYELRVRAIPGGLQVRESGLPLLTLAAPIWLMGSTARAADAHRRGEMEQKWQEQKAHAASPAPEPAPSVPSSRSSSTGDF